MDKKLGEYIMLTFVEILEIARAFGPFGAIIFGFYSINKTLKGNYKNSINIEKEKLRQERNSVATLIMAELLFTSEKLDYIISEVKFGSKAFRSNLITNDKSLYNKIIPRITCL